MVLARFFLDLAALGIFRSVFHSHGLRNLGGHQIHEGRTRLIPKLLGPIPFVLKYAGGCHACGDVDFGPLRRDHDEAA